jgi:hypothetical protein
MLPIINLRKSHFGVIEHLKCEMYEGYSTSVSYAKKENKTSELEDSAEIFETLHKEDTFEEDEFEEQFDGEATQSYYTEASTMDATYEVASEPIIKTSFLKKMNNFLIGGTLGAAFCYVGYEFIHPFAQHFLDYASKLYAQQVQINPSIKKISGDLFLAWLGYMLNFLFFIMVVASIGGGVGSSYTKKDKKILKTTFLIPFSIISAILFFYIMKETMVIDSLLSLCKSGGIALIGVIASVVAWASFTTPLLGAFYFKGFKSIRIGSFFKGLKAKIFQPKKASEILETPLAQDPLDMYEIFDDIRSKIMEKNQKIQNQELLQGIQKIISLIETLQISLDILLNCSQIETRQDAKTMINVALPQMFTAYFATFDGDIDEQIKNTHLFLKTLTRLNENFCVLAKDIVEFEKVQKHLSLTEALQFAENRFLKEKSTDKMKASL